MVPTKIIIIFPSSLMWNDHILESWKVSFSFSDFSDIRSWNFPQRKKHGFHRVFAVALASARPPGRQGLSKNWWIKAGGRRGASVAFRRIPKRGQYMSSMGKHVKIYTAGFICLTSVWHISTIKIHQFSNKLVISYVISVRICAGYWTSTKVFTVLRFTQSVWIFAKAPILANFLAHE